ncbi:MAG: hypothetical protein E4H46_01105 [Desulfobacterales bacterium]|nr:MAG: hypothetical protein E4H46_01105 [Desulfobacterales bacterium]
MEKLKGVGIFFVVVLMLGFMGPSFDGLGLAAEQSREQKADQKALWEGFLGNAGSQRRCLAKDDARLQGGFYLGFWTCCVN